MIGILPDGTEVLEPFNGKRKKLAQGVDVSLGRSVSIRAVRSVGGETGWIRYPLNTVDAVAVNSKRKPNEYQLDSKTLRNLFPRVGEEIVLTARPLREAETPPLFENQFAKLKFVMR